MNKEVQNTLATEKEKNGKLRQKLPFKSVTSDDILDFSEIMERDLKILFISSYQLSQSHTKKHPFCERQGDSH